MKEYKAGLQYRERIIKPDEYEEYLRNLCSKAVKLTVAASLKADHKDATKIQQKVMGQLRPSDGDDIFAKCLRNYSTLFHAHEGFLSVEKQDSSADYRERRRFLAFRILTALGIALIVLGTSWIAKCLEIALPLSRPF